MPGSRGGGPPSRQLLADPAPGNYRAPAQGWAKRASSEGFVRIGDRGEAMSRRRSRVINGSGENAMTWFLAGLVVIAVVAGFVGQFGTG